MCRSIALRHIWILFVNHEIGCRFLQERKSLIGIVPGLRKQQVIIVYNNILPESGSAYRL